MKELVEFLLDKCKEELKEEKLKGVDPRLKEELKGIREALEDLRKGKISSSTSVKMKDQLYDLISTLTDITISHSHYRPARIFCSPLQIGSRRKTRKRLRTISTTLKHLLDLEFLLDKCKEELKEEKLRGVDPHLTEELESIRGVLEDLGKEKINSSTSVKVKDELYGLISTLTDITKSHTHNRRAQNFCFRSRSNTKKSLRNIKTSLQKKLNPGQGTTTSNSPIPKGEDDAGSELPGGGTVGNSSNKEKEDCSVPKTLQKIKLENIQGFDDRLKEIEGRLVFQNRRGHIEIGIVGMCGSGKTTLAQLVYSSDSMVKEFELRIGVILPHQLTSNDTYFEQILRVILEQCGQDKGGDPAQCGQDKGGKQQLLRIIRNRLLGKSYLLVLDGVWDADMDWYFELGRALDWHYKVGDVGNDGSKSAVIITTRVEEVAKTMVGISALHHIHPEWPEFNKDTCWSIFINQVRQGKEIEVSNEILEKLKPLEDDIKEQCDGLPLAAVTLAKIIPDLIGWQREPGAAAQAGSSVL